MRFSIQIGWNLFDKELMWGFWKMFCCNKKSKQDPKMGRYSRNDGIVTDGTTGGWLVGGSTPPIPILRPTPVPSTFPRPIVPSPRYARPSLADSSCRKQIDLLSFWKITKRSFVNIRFWGSFLTPWNSTRPNWPRKVLEMKWTVWVGKYTVWYASNKTKGKLCKSLRDQLISW